MRVLPSSGWNHPAGTHGISGRVDKEHSAIVQVEFLVSLLILSCSDVTLHHKEQCRPLR